jgi:hypothetical protein
LPGERSSQDKAARGKLLAVPDPHRHQAREQPDDVEEVEGATSDKQLSQEQAAGLTRSAEPARKEVAAAWLATLAETSPLGEGLFIDFAHLKKQLLMAQVLDQLGFLHRLRGNGPQRKGPCPLHRGDGRGKTFSVNLEKNVFHCFDAACGKKGDVIDLWAAVCTACPCGKRRSTWSTPSTCNRRLNAAQRRGHG